jgi:biotin carboxylase
MNNNQTLMIVGGNWEQCYLIKTAVEDGYTVLLTDPDSNCPGARYASIFEVVNPRDLTQLIVIAEKYKPIGIVADECDYSYYAARFLSVYMNLNAHSIDSVQHTTNKHWMRDKVKEAEVLQPRYFACKTLNEVKSAIKFIDWPVVIKPVDNRGAFGVSIVNSEAELEKAFLDAVINAHSREVIVEAYIEGTHITVDGCAVDAGKHYNLAIASKKVTEGDKPIITEVVYPADIDVELKDHINDVNNRVVAALGITQGLTHSEYIVDKKGRCFLVESANRGGGVLTSAVIVPEISGINTNKLLIAQATGNNFNIEPYPSNAYIILHFFVFKEGKLSSISGVEKARSLIGVIRLDILVSEGDYLSAPESGAGRHGFAIVKAKSKQDVDSIIEQLYDMLEVTYVS